MGFNPVPVQDFIGNGLTFPIQLQNGRPLLSSGFDLIQASIRNILSYELGTRFFLAEFGSRLNDLIEEPNDEILANLLNQFIIGAVIKWEKRIQTISTSIVNEDDTTIFISITYQVLNVNTPDNFIWPFYKQIIY